MGDGVRSIMIVSENPENRFKNKARNHNSCCGPIGGDFDFNGAIQCGRVFKRSAGENVLGEIGTQSGIAAHETENKWRCCGIGLPEEHAGRS
jgi:hypothetical protein